MKYIPKKIISFLLAAALLGNTASLPVYALAEESGQELSLPTETEDAQDELFPADTVTPEESETPTPAETPAPTEPPQETAEPTETPAETAAPTQTPAEPEEEGEEADDTQPAAELEEPVQEEPEPVADGQTVDYDAWFQAYGTSQDGSTTYYSMHRDDLIKLSHVSASLYQKAHIRLVQEGSTTVDLTAGLEEDPTVLFAGLGSADYPFQGTLDYSGSTVYTIYLGETALFQSLSDRASVGEITLVRCVSGDTTHPLLAETVTGDGGGQSWRVTVSYFAEYDEETSTQVTYHYPAAGVLGTVSSGASVTLAVAVNNTAGFASGGSTGAVCNTLKSGASLTVTGLSGSGIQVTANTGSAGGLVGTMESGSRLTVSGSLPSDGNVTATNGAAGGLVGRMEEGATLSISSEFSYSGTVTASGDAGGLVGYAQDVSFENLYKVTVNGANVKGSSTGGLVGEYLYTGTGDNTILGTVTAVSLYGTTASGGVVGYLLNNSGSEFSFSYSGVTVTSSMQLSSGTASCGGLVGQYTADSLTAALTIVGGTVTATHYQPIANFGGLVGLVSGAAYVHIQDVSVTANQGNNPATNYGGLVGVCTGGGMLDVGSVTVKSSAYKVKAAGAAGGLVGQLNGGVLRLSGTTDLSGSQPSLTNAAYYGQLVGKNGDDAFALIYALGSGSEDGWTLKRCKSVRCSDIGNWGEVLRLGDTQITAEALAQAEKEAEEAGKELDLTGTLLIWDETAHTVTVRSASTTLSDKNDFALAALHYQLTETGALAFENKNSVTLRSALTITDDIDLSGTGLLSLTRDNETAEAFSGTLSGGGHTITLAVGQTYAVNGSEGSGQIYAYNNGTVYAHNLMGLLGKVTGSLSVSNLTLSGGIAFGLQAFDKQDSSFIQVGALASRVVGSATITVDTVTSQTSVTFDGVANSTVTAVGGLFAALNTTGGTVSLTVTGYTWASQVTQSGKRNDCRLGGMIGYVQGNNAQITVQDSRFQGSILQDSTNTTPWDAPVGGMIATITHDADKQVQVTIKNVTFDGVVLKPTTAANNNAKAGGLLGFHWWNCLVDIDGVTIQNCTIGSGNAASGGLMYKASGYWSIHGDGVTYVSGNTFTFRTDTVYPSSLLVVSGASNSGDSGLIASGGYALYLEIGLDSQGNSAFKVSSGAVTLTNTPTSFDEIMGQSIGGSGNAIVSIATANHALLNQTACSTYTAQLGQTYNSPYTRYYYNLDEYRTAENIAASALNSPQRLMLWSVKQYCASNLQSYFSTASRYTISGTLDLSGYSYYPVTYKDATTIEDASITFAYTAMNRWEKTASNKTFDNQNRQHYEMHTGLFQNVTGSLSVSNLTLAGTVGKVGDYSGALIRGTVGGSASSPITLTLDGLTLDGIALDGSTTTALLINQITQYTTLTVTGVKTTSAYTASGATVQVAGSLMGTVGSQNASGLYLTFSDMTLDARTAAGSYSSAYGTYNSIFTNATFITRFQAAVGGYTGVYNFSETQEASDSTKPTYGKELSDSVRNQDKQYWYYDTALSARDTANADTFIPNMTGAKSTTAFSAGYLPYVQNAGHQENDGSNYHELDVNQRSASLEEGCGTYGHPYAVDDGAQLEAVGAYLDSPQNADGLRLVVDKAVLTAKSGAKDYHTASQTGDITIVYNAGTMTWTAEGASGTYSYVQIQQYLSNAHYQVVDDITLSTQFAGLGGSGVEPSTATAMAFCGAIYGAKKADGTYPTVTVKVSGSTSQFAGLIKYSQGSVVKDLTLAYDGSLTITGEAVPTNSATQVGGSFFGGVVGYCLGGDTIIENVSVTGLNVSLSGSYDYLAAVGGFVGLVGGYAESSGLETKGGGVIFRSIASSGLTGDKASAGSGYFYYNPYVGRVLDGYAASENCSVDNTDKNYVIPQLEKGDSPSLVANRQDNSYTMSVSDAQGLWVLSAILNSGAASLNWYGYYAVTNNNTTPVNAYDYGRVRSGTDTASYAKDEQWWGGTANAVQYYRVCYLISNGYATLDAARIAAYPVDDSYTLTFTGTDYDMSAYSSGFRGIGGSYSNPTGSNTNIRLSRTLSLKSLTGSGAQITLNMTRKVYAAEEGGLGSRWTMTGVGLFPILNMNGGKNATSTTISQLTLSGTVTETVYDGATGSTTGAVTALSAVGGLAGLVGNLDNASSRTLTIQGVALSGLTVSGGKAAGGILGANGLNQSGSSNAVYNLAFTNCSYTGLSVTSDGAAGGLLGFMRPNTNNYMVTVKNTATGSAAAFADSTITSTFAENASHVGAGGLLGVVMGGKIQNSSTVGAAVTVTDLSLSGVTVQGSGTVAVGDTGGVGGLIGVCVGSGTTRNITVRSVTVTDMTVQGHTTSDAFAAVTGRNVGGVVGTVDGAENLILDSVTVKNATIQRGVYVGGLAGRLLSGCTAVTVTDCVVDGCFVYNQKTTAGAVGGVAGCVQCAGTVTVQKSTVQNNTLLGHGDGTGVGGVAGWLDHASLTLSVSNVVLKDNSLAQDTGVNEGGAGGLVGRVNSLKELAGYNLLQRDNVIGVYTAGQNASLPETGDASTGTYDSTTIGLNETAYSKIHALSGDSDYTDKNVGLWVGVLSASSSGKVHLLGVHVTGDERPNQDIGNYLNAQFPTDSYIVYANFQQAKAGTTFQTTDITTRPVTTILSGVSVSTQSYNSDGLAVTTTTTGLSLAGDGAQPKNDSATVVGAILAAYADQKDSQWNLTYSKAASDLAAFSTGGSRAGSLSTYQAAGENESQQTTVDFPVLVIDTNDPDSIMKLINSYLAVVTNQTYTKASHAYDSMEVTTYQQQADGSFQSVEATLRWDSAKGVLRVNGGNYDNTQNRFTVLTVKYKNPTDATGQSYFTLQIPVLVKKVLRFRFSAAVKAGASYYSGDYASLSDRVLSSLGEQITAYLSFTFYERTQAEWQSAVDSGEDLLWNFDMAVNLGTDALPVGTRLTLVDKNRGSAAYTLTVEEGTFAETEAGGGKYNHILSLSKFQSITDPDSSWDGMLCDYLHLTAAQSAAGAYVKLDSSTDATLRVDGEYYRPYVTGDTEVRYDITVGLGEEKASEDFYLTIETPATATGIWNNTITYEGTKLTGGNMPTQRSYYNAAYTDTKNASENVYILGSFFDQTMTVTTTNSDELMDSGDVISAVFTTHIQFKDGTAASTFNDHAKGLPLYQSFELSLRQRDAADAYTPVALAGKASATVSYEVKVGEQVIDDTIPGETISGTQFTGVSIEKYIEQYGSQGFDVIAYVELAYPDADSLAEQFPEREGTSDTSGVEVLGRSYIAFSQSASDLASSSMRTETVEDASQKHYYRGNVSDVNLSYIAVDTDKGDGTGDVSELGINASDLTYDPPVPIHSVAYYDVSKLADLSQATGIACELQLWQKNNNGTYVQVDASDYLSSVTGTVNHSVKATAGKTFTWTDTWSTTGDTPNDPADTEIYVNLGVKTGDSGFESEGHFYANYRLILVVHLLEAEDDGTVKEMESSRATDYIVFTNARVYTGIVPTTSAEDSN